MSLTMVGSNPRVMDVETSGAIEQLGRRIDALEGSLRSEFGSLRGEFGSLRGEFGSLRVNLGRSRSNSGRSAMNSGHCAMKFAMASRRTAGTPEVLFESLRDDIRMLAEGFATLTAKLDSRHG